MLVSFVLLASVFPLYVSAAAIPKPKGVFSSINPLSLLCLIPPLQVFCPFSGNGDITVITAIGQAHGVQGPSNVTRFSVQYGNAQRWQPSTVATTWNLPNGSNNASALPSACPQPSSSENSAPMDENCLSAVLYVPSGLPLLRPTMVWIHGGSSIVGSASAPGLDGSKLAIAANANVVVIQYRLGALGYMAPTGKTNLALGDVINALKFVQQNIVFFGGDPTKVTIAGQSSGAGMIRALLATPSASTLFRSAILQSDPMNFGFLNTSTQSTLQSYFNTQISCSATNTACHNSLTINQILAAQGNLFSQAPTLDPSAGNAMPIRPVRDGTLVTNPLDGVTPFPSVSKPLLVSTVAHEAGPAIYGNINFNLPYAAYAPALTSTFGPSRTSTIMGAPYYALPAGTDPNTVDARTLLQTLGTDYMWKCSTWSFVRNWVAHGGTAYAGMHVVGATYPDNTGIPYCTTPGNVCHEDDIQIVFGTVPSPTSAQSAAITQIQTRYANFLNSGNPGSWPAATSSNPNAILLGGSGPAPVNACDPSFWGNAVQYDYQVYGI